ncbi:MAG: hypothetical protein CVU48_03520 [Candidatus Cloacimonetes bacterium HGW-Cloacimonetes-1]|jgi:apolipoprotein D and lipocalin family protein|nr:MAG: hypothetical protein CVU48_03520 [Candidatus Cloacimonetes bacterium HGW-Cloacimonetes-1]
MKIYLILALLLVVMSVLEAKRAPLNTVENVDLDRYLGRWFQLAYFPNSFQPKGAAVTTAEYSLDPKGNIIVHNTSWADPDMKGVYKEITGKAFRVKGSTAKLRVQFFWPFRGDYWIISLDQKDYSYAVVSEPKQKYLWILTREQSMDSAIYIEILRDLKNRGFDLSKLVITGKIVKNNPKR